MRFEEIKKLLFSAAEQAGLTEYDVYYRFTDKYHNYLWNDSKYAMSIKSKTELTNEQIIQIIGGIKLK